MTKKSLFRKLGYLTLIICLVLAYLLVYLFPALVDINRARREIKNVTLRIQDLDREVTIITFPDKREKNIFQRTDTEYWERFPVLKNRKNRKEFIQKIASYIQTTAKNLGIEYLVMTHEGGVPDILIQTDFREKGDILLRLQKQIQNRYKEMSFPSDLSRDIVADSPSGERIHSTFFFLGFPAQLKVGLEMIIQIMDFSFQVEIEEILVKEGEGIPFFHLVFRGYCRLKNEVSSSRFPKREIG
ncbi:MAG: hypothetical protein KAT17_03225, partial [Candidatus Aminicenantes bacterium]|nr:hypothetical protein [Candidatus Aminicenantes bacterium]